MTPHRHSGQSPAVKTKQEHVAPAAESPSFETLGLPAAALVVLDQLGFATPTPIQVAAIPPLMEGRDVVGRARTGTGKTAAFGLPLLARLSERATGRPRGLILAPTRELALQVTEALKSLAHRPLRIVTVYGGAPYGPQLRALRDGVEVVVGTPGRIIDLLDRQALDLSELEMMVLDEADEMLKMGFIEDVETVLGATPAERQVALFSATMPEPIRRVAQKWLRDPVEAMDAKGASVEAIEQLYVQVPGRNKREALLRILQGESRTAALVFAATKLECDEVTGVLQRAGFAAEALHGDLSQPARERVVQQLRDRRLDLVVATDIAARGIDIDHLDLIVNLDLPKNVEVYTHRIGRTGRAGRKGRAITFVVPRESFPFVQAIGRMGVKVQELFLPSEKELVERRRAALITESKAWLEGGGQKCEVAKEWAEELVAEAGEGVGDLVAALLGKLAIEAGVSLSRDLDAGVPPWARQSGVLKPKAVPAAKARAAEAPHQPVRAEHTAPAPHKAAAAHTAPAPTPTRAHAHAAPAHAAPAPTRAPAHAAPAPTRAPAHAPREEPVYEAPMNEAPRPKKAVRAPKEAPIPMATPGDCWIVVGVGRNDGVRPSDLVGALANELGLPGASIGRIELRDASSLVQVADDFAERLGDGSWPLQVRRIDTEVRRHAAPQRASRIPPERPARGARESYDAAPARRPYAATAARPAHARSDGPRGEAPREGYAPRARAAAPRDDRRPDARPARAAERAPRAAEPSMGDRPPRRPRS